MLLGYEPSAIYKSVRIERGGLLDRHRRELSFVLFEAFRTKITALGIEQDVATEFLTSSIAADLGFYAYRGDDLLGVAGTVSREP